MSDEEIKELREEWADGWRGGQGSVPPRITRDQVLSLLDEVEKSRKLATEEDALWTSVHELLTYLLVTENLSPSARKRVEKMAAIVGA